MAIDPQMEKVVGDLADFSAKSAKGTFGGEQRPWMNFENINKVGQFDLAGLKALFSRDASNDEYGNLRSGTKGLTKDLQTAKLSGDFLAGMERDTRMRRRSRIRMFVHGGNRAAANGQSNGPLRCNTIDWLTRILAEKKT